MFDSENAPGDHHTVNDPLVVSGSCVRSGLRRHDGRLVRPGSLVLCGLLVDVWLYSSPMTLSGGYPCVAHSALGR